MRTPGNRKLKGLIGGERLRSVLLLVAFHLQGHETAELVLAFMGTAEIPSPPLAAAARLPKRKRVAHPKKQMDIIRLSAAVTAIFFP